MFKNTLNYIKNNRIREYEIILDKARSSNYEIISLLDYVNHNFDQSKNILLLRHDIDHVSFGANLMFELEKKYSAHSSFYFRNSTIDEKLIQEIAEYGSEVSLHFETIADFVKQHKITTKDELYKTNFKQECLHDLKLNLDYFRNKFKLPCLTIASHGEYENALVQTSNNVLTEDTASYAYLGIKLEAYDKNFIENVVTAYISDCPIEYNEGYRYGITPMEAMNNNEKFICFLSHPNHWHYNFYNQCRKILKTMIKKPIKKYENFKRVYE